MKKFESMDDILERMDSTVFRSDDAEYKRNVFSTLSLFRKKNTEGSLFDCERLAREVESMLEQRDRIHPSALLISEINICMLELYLKRKNQSKFELYYNTIATTLRTLQGPQREQQLTKINSLILYDFDLEVFPQETLNTSVTAVRLYKNGNIQQAVDYLKVHLNEYEPYIFIKKIVIGKMLLQLSKPEAFQWFQQVIVLNQQREYEKYEAKVLFVSGYRALVQKLRVDVSRSKIGNIPEMAKRYTQEMRQMNFICSKARNDQFRNLYAQGISTKLSSQQRKDNLEKALKMIQNMPCYPHPSVYEYDIRIKIVEQCVESGKFEQAKINAQHVIGIGNKLGMFNWIRQLKVNKCLARVLQHQGDKEGASDLVSRCMTIEQDKHQKKQLSEWRDQLNPDALETIQIQTKNDTNKLVKKNPNNPLAKFKIPQAKSLPKKKKNEQQEEGQASKQSQQEQKKCCCVLF